MLPKNITQQAEKIRNLIVEDKLDEAFAILMDLAKKADGNYWDESLNLNQDYTKLTNETRSGFLTPIQTETNRNLLIDRMLKLTRSIENNEGKPAVNTDAEEDNPSSSRGFNKILLGVLGIGILGVFAFLFFGKEDEIPVPVEPKIDVCTQTLDEGKTAFKEGNLDKAERIFITAKDVCTKSEEPEKWLERVEVMRQRNAPKPEEETNTNESKSIEKKPSPEKKEQPKIKEQNPPKQKEITPIKPSFPDNAVDSRATYVALRKKGDKAFREKKYTDAHEIYKQAKAIDPTSEIRGKLEAARDLCYRQFFSAGMDDYNLQKYESALVDFKKAQYYKDFSQVQGMIRKCEAALE